jgi:hypothetical protein
LTEEWKGSIILPIYKKDDKRGCSNYRGISRLSTTFKILSNILQSMSTPYAEEITGDHQCGLRRNQLTTDHISPFAKYWGKNGNTMQQCISYLSTSR